MPVPLGGLVVVLPGVELVPGRAVVGDVSPIGGVVPVVVVGVVPGVVGGVVPGVVLGVVPGVVLGSGGVLLGVVGGQIGVAVLEELPGKVAVELDVVDDRLDVLAPGVVVLLGLVDGIVVVVTGQLVAGLDCVVEGVAAEPGLGLCTVAPLGVLVDWVPGTTGVGVMAPLDACAVAVPTAKHRTRAIGIARVRINLSCCFHWWDGANLTLDAHRV